LILESDPFPVCVPSDVFGADLEALLCWGVMVAVLLLPLVMIIL
jgi:hypothetical protein